MSGAAAVRTAYRLNVSKTKLYRLAKQYYPEIGPMKAATFIKYPRSRDYALDFKAGEHYHHLFLSVCGGQKGQPARPFINTANARKGDEAVKAAAEVYDDFLKSKNL